MKIFDISKFTGDRIEDVVDYLKEELRNGLQNIMQGFRSLSFHDNFKTFAWEGSLDAGETKSISNTLKTVPAYRLIVREIPTTAGTIIIDDTSFPWTKDVIYLRNSGSANAKIKVVFFGN
jgi:hypothetical protein